MIKSTLLAQLVVGLLIQTPLHGGTVYNDPGHTDWQTPEPVMVQEGSNPLSGTLEQDGFCPDYYTLIVPEGLHITELNVLAYETVPGNNGSFLGIQPGQTLTVSPFFLENPPVGSSPIPINNILINDSQIGMGGLLGTLTVGAPLNGTPTLGAGNYALWLNETSTGAIYEIDFVATPVPEPSVPTLLILAASLARFRRRRTR